MKASSTQSKVNVKIREHHRSLHQDQQSSNNDSLFLGKQQKELLIQRLKKGTLFRLSNHIKYHQKIIEKDPFLNWLQQTSKTAPEQQKINRTMGQTFFYLNTQNFQKQKNSSQIVLPKILKHNQKSSEKFSSHLFKKTKINSQNSQLLSKLPVKGNKACYLGQNPKNNLNKSQIVKKNHKQQCYEDHLSKTQFFSKKQEYPFYSMYPSFQSKHNEIDNNQNILRSFNNNSKIERFCNFKQSQIREDIDLKRIKGLQTTTVKPFESNLICLEKKANLSCYNDVSKYFDTMQKEIKIVIQDSKMCQKLTKKMDHSFHLHRSNFKRFEENSNVVENIQENNKQIPEMNRKYERENTSQKLAESHLPNFLMKSLLFPRKKSTELALKSPKKEIEKPKFRLHSPLR